MVDKQPALWEQVGSLLGDKIVAVHYKGEAFDEAGNPVSTSLEDSVIDFDSAFEMLRALPQKLPVLREEAVPRPRGQRHRDHEAALLRLIAAEFLLDKPARCGILTITDAGLAHPVE